MDMEIRYYYPISGNVILCYFAVLAALIFTVCDWIYANIMVIAIIAMILALGLVAFHSFVRIVSGANKFVTIISSVVSEFSSMLYLILCLLQAVEFVVDEPILGLFPLIFGTPFSFGAWVLIKQPSLVASNAPKTWLVACDGIVTVALVIFFIWLFDLSGYIGYIF